MKTKKVKYVLLSVALAALLVFTAVVPVACSCGEPKDPEIDAPEFKVEKIADFANGANEDVVYARGGDGNGSVFNVEWNTENVEFVDDVARMKISEIPEGTESQWGDYYGAELRTNMWYHYGYYSVSMKPSKDSGTASTFFTYTGPYGEYDEEGNLHPWDEIDIEFLGKDTTKVQFNYYVNGKGGHEYMYDLGFDASEEFHTYGFLWEEDAITWYVDSEPVYQVTSEDEKPKTEGLPSTPGRIMLNHWCGTKEAEGWMDAYEGYSSPVEYQWIGTTSDPIEPITTPPSSEDDKPSGEASFTAGEDIALEFTNAADPNAYTIEASEDGKSVDVTYSELGNTYDNIIAQITDEDEGKNAFGVTLANNGEKDVAVRIDVRDNVNITSDSSGNTYGNGVPRHSCLNAWGFSREAGAGAWTTAKADTEWGGSQFTVPAGKTYELGVMYDTENFVCGNITKTGPFSVSDITIFIDSHVQTGGPFSGDVTFSKINFGTATFEEGGEQPGEEEKPLTAIITEGKTYQVNPIASEETTALTLSSTAYTVKATGDNKSADITYSDLKGNSYQIVQIMNTTAEGDNVFALKVKNNGTATVNFRLNVLNNGKNINVGATQDGVGVRTDMEWGGSFFTIDAGKTVDVVVYFSGPASEFQFMIDSSIGSEDAHSGNVTVSEYRIGTATPAEVA